VKSEKIELAPRLKHRLNESLLLFYTRIPRRAESILDEQNRNVNDRREILHRIKALACLAREELQAGNLDVIGHLLHKNWELKKQLASQVSNGTIDAIYQAALDAGAVGGKITGAGGGGFFLLYCPIEKKEAVRDALSTLVELPFNLEPDGSKVIFNYRR
jgi:D-glycero-alpha-D-manno-heptose-7-phosphate kinase